MIRVLEVTGGPGSTIEFRREALPPLAVLEAEWRALEPAAATSFFTSWRWIGTLLATLPDSKQPDLLRGQRRGETVALALLGARPVRRRGLIRARALFLNETGDPDFDLTIEHNGLLVAAQHRQAANAALIDWFAGASADEADELYINGALAPLPEEIIAGHGLGCRGIEVPSYWVVLNHLAGGDGELYPVLSSNARQQLRRAMRHYERFGPVRLEHAGDRGKARAFFAELKELHIATWQGRGKPHSFSRPYFETFHAALIERHVDEGAVQLLRASAGPRLIGYLYNFCYRDRVYAYQSGFAYGERAARPGAVAHALAIREAYRSGAAAYDFLAGNNRLKESFATDTAPMLWQVVQQPRLALRAERLARDVKQRLACRLVGLARPKKRLPMSRQNDRDAAASPSVSGRQTTPPRL